jgi:23S rRNA (uracil1939-C5)-methyltransferase
MTEKLQVIMPRLRQILVQSEKPSAIGHIELLEDDLGCSVLLRLTSTLTSNDEILWTESASSHGWDLYLQAPSLDKVKCDEESLRQYSLEGLSIYYHPQDFIQVNKPMNDKMVAQALQWLDLNAQDKVLDLFCGAGNFSLPMAKTAAKVVGVEVQPQMVLNGERNASLNGLENVTFIGADLTQKVTHSELKKGFTKALLDPPRAGAFEFLPSLIKLKIETILYVSCDAATLARDAEFLVEHGYKVKRVSMMEMFPQTAHVETMMLLQKKH